MYISRDLEETIHRYLASPEIIAIVGPRQAGKTTMIRRVMEKLPSTVSISFDNQNQLAMFERNPDDFISAYVKGNRYLFIDEFQYAKAGGKILKYIFDTNKIKIIISGSSAADLTVQAIKFLVGRIFVLHLYPFNFQEFLSAKDPGYLKLYKEYKAKIDFFKKTKLRIPEIIHKKISQYHEEYLRFGGYPRVVLEERIEAKQEILRNIYNTYFLREVRDLLGLIDDYKLSNLMKGLALQIGNLIEYKELSRLSGYSHAALKKYLNFLEKTYICRLTRPFYKNKRAEIVKNPKVYFVDTGLRHSVINDFRPLNERIDAGSLLENGLASEFIKKNREFYFWRDKKKNELDFIVSLGSGKSIAIESKIYLKNIDMPAARIFQKAYPAIPVLLSYKDCDKRRKDTDGIYPIYLY